MINKRIKHILAVGSVWCGIAAAPALFSSCSDDWLSLSNPFEETADTFWETTEQFDQGLSAAYSTWRRPGYFSRWFQVLMILRGDEGWSESPNPEFQADANFVISAYNYDGNEGLNFPWQATSTRSSTT